MSDAPSSENLDERMERIKRRNEEIEKKYREAEEDRLMALKDNAMVAIRPPKDEDWPREHKYDNLELFSGEPKEGNNDESAKGLQEKPISGRAGKEYKKFADGEGPPPDPAYNFLADSERDRRQQLANITPPKAEQQPKAGDNSKKDWKQGGTFNRARGGGNGGSFRGRGKNHSGNQKISRANSHTEYDTWKNEREKIDEERINRQKTGEGRWRREWDNEKLNSQRRASGGDANTRGGRSKSPASKSPDKPTSDGLTETKRGNIMVSLTKEGEVKSVKLTPAPVIGSGRVGPRQITKPHYLLQKTGETQSDANLTNGNTQKDVPHKRHINNLPTTPIYRAPRDSKPFVPQQPIVASQVMLPILDVDRIIRPEFVKMSVQDRLNRNRIAGNNNEASSETLADHKAIETNITAVSGSIAVTN